MSWLPNWITGLDEENTKAGEAADRRNAEINRKLHDEGKLSDSEYLQAQLHDKSDDFTYEDAKDSVQDAFDDELSRRTSGVRNVVGGGINAIFKSVFGVIPWQVWLIGLFAGAWYLGLFNGLLKGGLKKVTR